MKRPGLVTALLTAGTLVFAACGGSGGSSTSGEAADTTTAPDTTTPAACTESVPYTSGDGDYDTYRIPAALTTGAGTVLAFAEGRRDSSADHGDIDTILRRSTDGGCTWSPVQVVTSAPGANRNNPAVVFDPATDTVILITLSHPDDVNEVQIRRGDVPPEDSMRVFVQTSDDDGVSFAEPREITDQVKDGDWRWYAVGPGHGVVLEGGDHAGRIVFGANHSIAPPAESDEDGYADELLGAHVIFSDDNGATWQTGFVQDEHDGVVNGNETAVAQLPDGSLHINTRNQNGSARSNRAGAISEDGGVTLAGPLDPIETLEQVPVIEASILQLAGADAPLLLSAPSQRHAREALTIFASSDGGATWKVAKKISDAPAAYSDLVQLDDATIGLLYETGTDSENETITFLRIDIDTLDD